MKKHSRFEYKTFAQKRERMVSALSALDADEGDSDALSILQDAIDDNADTIEYLKYMTPFYKQVVASRFHEMSGSDWEICEYAAERVLDVDREDFEILISWVFEKVRELYTYCDSFVFLKLHHLRSKYLHQNPDLDPNLVFDFRFDPDHLDVDHVRIFEDEDQEIDTRHFRAKWIDIESNIGYLGVVYVFLNTANVEYSRFWPYTDMVYVRYDRTLDKDPPLSIPRDRRRGFNMYEMFEEILDCVQGGIDFPTSAAPMWMMNTVHSMDFYCESIHLTRSKSGRYAKGPFEVTPETLETKLSDYRSASVATYQRDLPLVTSVKAPRSLVFSWDDYNLCEGGFAEKKSLDSDYHAYGENCIFLFSKSNVTLCKESDFALETVSLLSAVEETIPCIIEYVHPEHIAFIGQQGDLPILVIDESDDPPRPFVCHVLSELRKYLLSSEYQSSDNLNSVPVLTRTQVDEYLISGQRPNPSREWFETQSLQNDENGFLINPDTNDIYWYHGNRYGDCGGDWSDSGHRYLSSDIHSAQQFMDDAKEANYPCVVCEYTVQIPASQIYDARKTQDGTVNPDRIEDLDYQNYDYNQNTVYELGDYKGFLEVERPYPPTAANLGIHLSHNRLLRVTREIEYCPNCVQAEVTDHGDFRECPKCSFRSGECDDCGGWVEFGKSCPWCED